MIPVFILSSERSGSNLLRRILGSHSSISAPPPINLFNTLSESLLYSGPLNNKDNIKSLINDAIKRSVINGTHLSWEKSATQDIIYSQLKNGSLPEIVYQFYKFYADREDNELCIIKENNLYHYVDEIVKLIPNAKFIFLARDVRDVVCSNKKIKLRKRHVYALAHQWREENVSYIKLYNKFSLDGNIEIVRYEDLLDDFCGEIKRLSNFLNIEFEEDMLDFYIQNESNNEAKQTEFWKNLNKPLMNSNKGKFFNELSKREIRIIETITSDVLEILGYPIFSKHFLKIGFLRRLKYHLLDNIYRKIFSRDAYVDRSIQNLRAGRKQILKNRKDHQKAILKEIKYFNEK